MEHWPRHMQPTHVQHKLWGNEILRGCVHSATSRLVHVYGIKSTLYQHSQWPWWSVAWPLLAQSLQLLAGASSLGSYSWGTSHGPEEWFRNDIAWVSQASPKANIFIAIMLTSHNDLISGSSSFWQHSSQVCHWDKSHSYKNLEDYEQRTERVSGLGFVPSILSAGWGHLSPAAQISVLVVPMAVLLT